LFSKEDADTWAEEVWPRKIEGDEAMKGPLPASSS
jgi:hypothetical protein